MYIHKMFQKLQGEQSCGRYVQKRTTVSGFPSLMQNSPQMHTEVASGLECPLAAAAGQVDPEVVPFNVPVHVGRLVAGVCAVRTFPNFSSYMSRAIFVIQVTHMRNCAYID